MSRIFESFSALRGLKEEEEIIKVGDVEAELTDEPEVSVDVYDSDLKDEKDAEKACPECYIGRYVAKCPVCLEVFFCNEGAEVTEGKCHDKCPVCQEEVDAEIFGIVEPLEDVVEESKSLTEDEDESLSSYDLVVDGEEDEEVYDVIREDLIEAPDDLIEYVEKKLGKLKGFEDVEVDGDETDYGWKVTVSNLTPKQYSRLVKMYANRDEFWRALVKKKTKLPKWEETLYISIDDFDWVQDAIDEGIVSEKEVSDYAIERMKLLLRKYYPDLLKKVKFTGPTTDPSGRLKHVIASVEGLTMNPYYHLTDAAGEGRWMYNDLLKSKGMDVEVDPRGEDLYETFKKVGNTNSCTTIVDGVISNGLGFDESSMNSILSQLSKDINLRESLKVSSVSRNNQAKTLTIEAKAGNRVCKIVVENFKPARTMTFESKVLGIRGIRKLVIESNLKAGKIVTTSAKYVADTLVMEEGKSKVVRLQGILKA